MYPILDTRVGLIKPYIDLKVYPFNDACIVELGTVMDKKIEDTNLELSLSTNILKNRKISKVGTNVSLKVYREQDLTSNIRANTTIILYKILYHLGLKFRGRICIIF